MFDASTPASTITANVERLAAPLTDGREVKMYAVADNCGTPCCILGWAAALDVMEVVFNLSEDQRASLFTPRGFSDHKRHSPAVAQAAASELRRLSAGGEPNPRWLQEAIEAEGK